MTWLVGQGSGKKKIKWPVSGWGRAWGWAMGVSTKRWSLCIACQCHLTAATVEEAPDNHVDRMTLPVDISQSQSSAIPVSEQWV